MRVAFVVPGPLDGSTGGYVYDEKLVERLRDRHEVEVVVVPRSSSVLGKFRPCGSEYDIVLQDELCRGRLVAVNPLLDAPVVAVTHLLASKDPTCGRGAALVERAYLRTVDACVYTSAASRDASPVGVPSVVARPASRFSPGVTEEDVRERSDEEGLRAVFVGNVSRVKGLETAVLALRKAEGWHLTVAGKVVDSGYARRVRRLAVTEGVSDRVDFVGFVEDGALSSLLRRSHAVVVPSVYEGFGTAYAEGMSFGLPAVGSAAGGASELIEEGENGWLVEPGDYERVTRVLCRLSEDREALAEAGVAALKTARERPSWEETSRKAVGFVERIAGRER